MDQNNEKPIKESVFLTEVIAIMVLNKLIMQCLLFLCGSTKDVIEKDIHSQKRKYASSLGSTSDASSSPKSSPDTSPQHSRWNFYLVSDKISCNISPQHSRWNFYLFSDKISPQHLGFYLFPKRYVVISLFLSPSFSGLVFSSWWSCIWFVFCDQNQALGSILAFSNSSLILILMNL